SGRPSATLAHHLTAPPANLRARLDFADRPPVWDPGGPFADPGWTGELDRDGGLLHLSGGVHRGRSASGICRGDVARRRAGHGGLHARNPALSARRGGVDDLSTGG